jgi:hypothetical protein
MISIMPASVAQVFARLDDLKVLTLRLSATDFPVGLIFRKEYESSLTIILIKACCDAVLSRADAFAMR